MQKGICGCKTCGCSKGLLQVHLTLECSVFSGEVTVKLVNELEKESTELILVYNHHATENFSYKEYITSTLGRTYDECLEIISKISKIIESHGIKISRVKIEAAPHANFSQPVLYYESHYKVTEKTSNYPYSQTLSKDRAYYNNFVTLRSKNKDATIINIDHIRRTTECVLLDTNPDLDREWYESYTKKEETN